jgi:hypothetical protein
MPIAAAAINAISRYVGVVEPAALVAATPAPVRAAA